MLGISKQDRIYIGQEQFFMLLGFWGHFLITCTGNILSRGLGHDQVGTSQEVSQAEAQLKIEAISSGNLYLSLHDPYESTINISFHLKWSNLSVEYLFEVMPLSFWVTMIAHRKSLLTN